MKFVGLRFTGILIVVLYLMFQVSSLAAQETPTVTPAPSKTPVADEDIDAEATEEVSSGFVAFTQNDLNVLSGNVQRPNGIEWFDGKLFTVCNGDWTVYEIDDTSGSTRTYIYGIRNAHELFAEADVNGVELWVPDFDLNALMLVSPARAPSTVASGLDGAWGIDVLDSENFLITTLNDNRLSRVSRTGAVETLLEGLRSPTGVVSDSQYTYYANNGSARRSIEYFEKSSIEDDEEIEVSSLVSGLQNTTGLVIASDGFLYFSYALGTRGVVGRVDPEICREAGGCSNDEVEIVLYTELPAPLSGLTISPDMRLFIHTIYRPEIYWVQLPE